MINTIKHEESVKMPIRLLPGVVIVLLQWLIRFGLPVVWSNAMSFAVAVMTGMAGALAVMVWWAFFSKAPKTDRWLGIVCMVGILALTHLFIDKSIQTGMMGMMYSMYALPVLSLAFVLWASISRYMANMPRRVWMVLFILAACASWTLVRSVGINGLGGAMFTWRWTPTAEAKLLAQGEEAMDTAAQNTEPEQSPVEWPGFRGPRRDSIIHGTSIMPDWTKNPPAKMWQKKIGPGCSSFAVHGKFIYTQEQRGKYEMVTCYHLDTGKPVWQHKDKERFWDSHAGAGPRSTPTLDGKYVYTFGPTGILNVLNAGDGSVLWTRQVGKENQVKLPIWALTSSPLVVNDKVIIAAEGLMIAYDRLTGEEKWRSANGGKSYSSPQLMTLEGVEQVLLISASGVISVNADDGNVFWEYSWHKGEPITQPALTENGDLLITSGDGFALRRLSVKKEAQGWKVEEKWMSDELKPYFNDIVVHKGHIYGFDAPKLVCLNADDGSSAWRGGNYGGGQLMLLADQDLLIVISEQGELALVKASPEKYEELAHLPGIEGRVWNHPVLVGDVLLLRNSQEMAAYKLAEIKKMAAE